MITTESSNREFHRFFDEHRDELRKWVTRDSPVTYEMK